MALLRASQILLQSELSPAAAGGVLRAGHPLHTCELPGQHIAPFPGLLLPVVHHVILVLLSTVLILDATPSPLQLVPDVVKLIRLAAVVFIYHIVLVLDTHSFSSNL
jgi:hypothetical protein